LNAARFKVCRAISLFGLIALSPLANAGTSDAEFCFARSGSFRIDIDVCGRALTSESISPLTRATLYLRRAEAFLKGRAYDLAHKDIDQALLLYPHSSHAFALRGKALAQIGKYDLSTKSYDSSIKLNIHSAGAYKGRGLANFHQGRFKQAISDFNMAHVLASADPETIALTGIAAFARGDDAAAVAHLEDALGRAYPYPLGYLWLYFAAKRAQQPFRRYVDEGLRETSPEIWPGPLIRAAFGRSPASTAWRAARQDKRRSARRMLQTAFYLGVAKSLDENRPEAKHLLARALQAEPLHDAIELPVARQMIESLDR